MKKGKRLLVLVAVAAVFGVGAYLLNLNAKQQEAAEEAAKEGAKTVLMTTPADTLAQLSYSRGGETVTLARKADAWVYAPRETFALDTDKVTAMAGDLQTVESVRTVADTEVALADYGLQTPALVITATDTKGAAQTISLGDQNATTGNYYATVAGKPGIYTVSADLYNAFDVSLMQLLKDEAYPTVGEADITGVDWSNGSETHSLTHRAEGDANAYTAAYTWFDQRKDGALQPVNDTAVQDFLTAATGITYQSTVTDQKNDLAAYGLDAPQLTVTLHYTEQVKQSEAQAAIAAEKAAAQPTATPAVTATPAATATVAPTATATATQAATATVAPTATVTATPAATATVAPTATATATPTVTPTATATLSGRAGAALAEDASAVPGATDATAEPTATPEPTVPVERTLTLWFGKADADGNVYMTHNKTQRVFLVSADTLTALCKLADADLKLNRPLALSLNEVTGMTVTMGNVTKKIEAATTMATGTDGTAAPQTTYRLNGQEMKTTQFTLFVNNLKALKAESYTDTPVAEGAQPILLATFTQSRPGSETVTAAYYPYDENFDQAVVNGDATMLVNKRDVEKLQTYFDGMVAVPPTATPTATVAAP